MMTRMDGAAARIDGCEMVMARVVDAPREVVFSAWRDVAEQARWRGPGGSTMTTQAFDFRTGGFWNHILHGAEGVDSPHFCRFLEVTPAQRIVYTHTGAECDGDNPEFRTTITFARDGDGTCVTMRWMFRSPAALQQALRDDGALEGGQETLDRLADFLLHEEVAA